MIELFVAFGAGLISFLSPCVLPLIPGYISYISGSSLNELLEKKTINIFPIVLFTFGFSIVFISFRVTATFLISLICIKYFNIRNMKFKHKISLIECTIWLSNIDITTYKKTIDKNSKSANIILA